MLDSTGMFISMEWANDGYDFGRFLYKPPKLRDIVDYAYARVTNTKQVIRNFSRKCLTTKCEEIQK